MFKWTCLAQFAGKEVPYSNITIVVPANATNAMGSIDTRPNNANPSIDIPSDNKLYQWHYGGCSNNK
jgi:hypothetical protein